LTPRVRTRKLRRPVFVNDATTSVPKWKDYIALDDKHLRLHFSNVLT